MIKEQLTGMSAMAAIAVMALSACSTPRQGTAQTAATDNRADDAPEIVTPDPHRIHLHGMEDLQPAVRGGASNMLPKAVAYTMSGDYADHVAVTLTPDGKSIVSYPAPTDLTENSTPVPMGDGWYLSRCGITAQSHFTRYTYEQYRALKQAPTPQQLLDSLIPGAVVTSLRTLPMTLQEAIEEYSR